MGTVSIPKGLSASQQEAVDSIINLPDDSVPKSSGGMLVESIASSTNILKVDGTVETNPGSVRLGRDGLEVSPGTRVLALTDAYGANYIPMTTQYNSDGVVESVVYDLTDDSTFIVASVFTTQLADPQEMLFQFPVDSLISTFGIRPATAGNIRVQSFAGPLDTGPVILDVTLPVLISDVGTILTLDITKVEGGNVVFFYTGDEMLLKLSGVELFGGLQTDGLFIGQTKPYIESGFAVARPFPIANIGDTSNISDDYARLNSEYTSTTPTQSGISVIYQATSTTDSVAGERFTNGEPSTTNPTVVTVGSAIFSQNDIVSITGSRINNGLFEVESHILNDLTIRGVGTVGTVEDFTRDDFFFYEDSAVITKVNVSVIRSGTSGDWETGKGSETPLSFSAIGAGLFGTEFEEFSSLPQSSTTSGSFQSKLSVTTSTKPAGKYRISFTAQITNKKKEKGTDLEFKVDGVAQHTHSNGGDYLFHNIKEDNGWVSESITTYTTLGSPATIDLDISYRKDEDEARISDARIDIWRVS